MLDISTPDYEALEVAAPKVEVLSKKDRAVKTETQMTLAEIIAKEGSYLREDGPPENKETYDGLLSNFVAQQLTVSAEVWRNIGNALCYMEAADVPARLGYKNLEQWLNHSVRPLLKKDRGATSLLQWMNYADTTNRLAGISPEAEQNLEEISIGVTDIRSIHSLVSNPATIAKGVNLSLTDEKKEEYLRLAAESISSISMEEVDPNIELPEGTTLQDLINSEKRKTFFKMEQACKISVLAEVARDTVDTSLIHVGRFYELVGDYSYYIEEETDEGTRLKKVKFDFKGNHGEEDRWVEVMSFDEDEMTVTIRPWIYYGMEKEERLKKDMHEDGTLRRPISVCLLNFKEESKIALTQQELEGQGVEMTITATVPRSVAKQINKAIRNKIKEHPEILSDITAAALEEYARTAEVEAKELSAKKKAEAMADD